MPAARDQSQDVLPLEGEVRRDERLGSVAIEQLEEENTGLKRLVADQALEGRMKAIAGERRRFGYRRLYTLLRRERRVVNLKRA